MRNALITLVFLAICAGIVWGSIETPDNSAKPCCKLHCTCSPEKVSEARHAREARDFEEFVLDASL